jgi:SAM-dependent methyltransferase
MELAAVDEIHIGGLSATLAFGRTLRFDAGSRVIDLGCGIGGPARIFAEGMSIKVTGVDLVEEYVAAARELSGLVGLASSCSFVRADISSLPFEAATFDGAYMIALGMNVADKLTLFREARRVLKPGARFGVCDPVTIGEGAVPYPLPWAGSADTSYLEPLSTYCTLMEAAGFAIEKVVERGALARRFFAQSRDAAGATPQLDLSALFGEQTDERVANISSAVEAGIIAPVEIVARAQ